MVFRFEGSVIFTAFLLGLSGKCLLIFSLYCCWRLGKNVANFTTQRGKFPFVDCTPNTVVRTYHQIFEQCHRAVGWAIQEAQYCDRQRQIIERFRAWAVTWVLTSSCPATARTPYSHLRGFYRWIKSKKYVTQETSICSGVGYHVVEQKKTVSRNTFPNRKCHNAGSRRNEIASRTAEWHHWCQKRWWTFKLVSSCRYRSQ